jgi:large subunit ribosomal protein L23
VTKDPREVVLSPVVSEKSYALLDANTYTFIVRPDANKTEIKEAVQAIFSVRVTNVNTLNRKGKRKRTRQVVGVRKSTKRALVTLHPDDKIEIFEAK